MIDQLNAVLAFENGEWADIKFDKDLSQWGERGIANGKKKWKAEPSTNSVLFSGTECQRLEWYYPVDQPYVVEVSVEVVKHERSYASKLAGVVAGDLAAKSVLGTTGGIPPSLVGGLDSKLLFGSGLI